MTSAAVAGVASRFRVLFRESARQRFCFTQSERWRIRVAATLILLSCWFTPPGFARDLSTIIAGPYFHEQSNSYYELHRLPGFRHEYSWRYAQRKAEQNVYKNVRGQLAIVDSYDVHRFLIDKFDFRGPTWIGLRYLCYSKKLIWVNGQELNRGTFAPWHPQWAGNPHITCLNKRMSYMGAYYVGRGTAGSLWQVQAQKKAFPWYLVQYKMPD